MKARITVQIALMASVAFGGMAAHSSEPIKVGVMFPYTGNSSTQGLAERDAIQMAFEEENNTVAGRKIELLFEDSAGKPDIGLTKVKALVERDGADILISELVSQVGAAVAPYVTEKQVPWVSTVSLASLTRAQSSPYIFRFVPSSYQFGVVAAEAARKMGWKKVYFIGWNAPASHESFEAIKKVFGEENVVEAMFPNVGTPDYAPYLTKMASEKADGVFAAVWGADANRLVQQYRDYGISQIMPLFGLGSFTSEELLSKMPAATEGVLSAYSYCGSEQSAENQKFVTEYQTRFGIAPGAYQYLGYVSAKMVIEALKKVDGKIEDKEAFLAALKEAEFKGPMGPTSFDDRRGMVGDFHILKVGKNAEGKLFNECIEKIVQVKDPYDLFP